MKPRLLFIPRPVPAKPAPRVPLLHLSPIQVYRLMQKLPPQLRVPSRVKES